MTKLKIDFQLGILEVEGEETFVKMVYQDYKDKLNTDILLKASQEERKIQTKEKDAEEMSHKPEKRKSKSRSVREALSIVKDLDLSSKSNKQSLRDFYKEKQPQVGMENNAVFVYYMQKIAAINGITVNHVYSCYKDVGARVPTALRQSLIDTSHNKGWIDTASLEDIKVATPGENFVEHDLPKQDTNKK
jgi:hypothetical protein